MRRVLPGAQIAVDVFRVVHLAVKMTGGVRRRVVRGTYGRRGRSGDPEYGTRPASAGASASPAPGAPGDAHAIPAARKTRPVTRRLHDPG